MRPSGFEPESHAFLPAGVSSAARYAASFPTKPKVLLAPQNPLILLGLWIPRSLSFRKERKAAVPKRES